MRLVTGAGVIGIVACGLVTLGDGAAICAAIGSISRGCCCMAIDGGFN